MAQIDIVNIKKSYGTLEVLHDINLTVQEGEFLVLVGPSGCGKSTLLRTIAGLEDINSGTIAFNGHPANQLSPQERNLAMVFQDYALYPHMSVRKNISFGLRLQKLKKTDIEERVSRVANILGLEEYLDRKPRSLSGGQRQRVAMGRAMVRDPGAFLFDEPLSNLDAKLRVQMRSEIVDLQRNLKATTVYVTHDQLEAMTMGDRIAIMDKGNVVQVDTPLGLYHRPKNLFVACFIGSPQMNIIDLQKSLPSIDPHIQKLKEKTGLRYVGMRPEHLQLEPINDGVKIPVEDLKVHVIGAYTSVIGQYGQFRVEANLDGITENLEKNETLYIPKDKLYCFDEAGEFIN